MAFFSKCACQDLVRSSEYVPDIRKMLPVPPAQRLLERCHPSLYCSRLRSGQCGQKHPVVLLLSVIPHKKKKLLENEFPSSKDPTEGLSSGELWWQWKQKRWQMSATSSTFGASELSTICASPASVSHASSCSPSEGKNRERYREMEYASSR